MPQCDEEAGKLDEALKDGEYAVVSDLDAAKVLQPGIGALDFPPSPVASQLAFVFEAAVANVAAIRSNQFRPALHHPLAERIGVISPIGNHAAQPGGRPRPARGTLTVLSVLSANRYSEIWAD